jgi:hypothetical protein
MSDPAVDVTTRTMAVELDVTNTACAIRGDVDEITIISKAPFQRSISFRSSRPIVILYLSSRALNHGESV